MTASLPIPAALGLAAAFIALSVPAAEAGSAESAAAAASAPAHLPAGLEACAQLRADAERLACYDRFVAPKVRGGGEAAAADGGAPAVASAASDAAGKPRAVHDKGEYLDQFWELTPERKRGIFNFDGYRPSYFLPVHATSRANSSPTSPAPGHSGQLPDYRDIEAKLQISVRTKLVEGLVLPNADLWFAYTQQSLWQLYSGDISRPFRATDHEPELFYVVPTGYALPGGIRFQMAGIGIAHQSNGQSLPFSRSWNRVYAMAGLERGDFALTARQNWRMHESDGKDDNPDLTDYRGRTELLGIWTPGFMTLSGLWKTNFKAHRGSLQLDWTMPVSRKDPKGLRWYAQVFTGYGESLIEYNFKQTSLGAGVTLFGW
ncbi:MAG: phospholipase A [Burkholderiales bacterium]|nr:phospholipase A [Burkholderiales bacterium]